MVTLDQVRQIGGELASIPAATKKYLIKGLKPKLECVKQVNTNSG